MKVIGIVQARTGSKRLPGKVFMPLAGSPLIWHIFNRLSKSKYLKSIVLATTKLDEDDKLEDWANQNNILCVRGSEDNVLNRFYETAKANGADLIVRITADDPFKDPSLTDEAINYILKNQLDFVSNNNPPSYPEGLDVEVFTMDALELANQNAATDFEKEHVTQYFYKNPARFKIGNMAYSSDLSNIRLTVDTKEDYEMSCLIFNKLYVPEKIFSFKDVVNFLNEHPEIRKMNQAVVRSTMYLKNISQ